MTNGATHHISHHYTPLNKSELNSSYSHMICPALYTWCGEEFSRYLDSAACDFFAQELEHIDAIKATIQQLQLINQLLLGVMVAMAQPLTSSFISCKGLFPRGALTLHQSIDIRAILGGASKYLHLIQNMTMTMLAVARSLLHSPSPKVVAAAQLPRPRRPATHCCHRSSSSSSSPNTRKKHASLKNHAGSRIRSRPSTTSAHSPPFLAQIMKKKRNILPMDLVQSQIVKSALPIIGNGSYIALASGFLMTDMLSLRLALIGGYTGLVAFHVLHPRPLRIPLKWSAMFIAVNVGAACFLIADQWPGAMSTEEEELYDKHFPMLTRGQFKQLLSLGTTQTGLPDGSRLTEEGVHTDNIYFMKRGNSKLYLHDTYSANIDEGAFVNDVAFQQGDGAGAYGTVITQGPTEVIVWEWSALRDHLESRPEMDKNMKFCFTEHLVRGLLQQREVANSKRMNYANLNRKDTPLRNLHGGQSV